MEYKEILLSKITAILSDNRFIPRNNSSLKKSLKCCGLASLYNTNSVYLEPYSYNYYNGRTYENPQPEYDLFIGLDNIFTELYSNNNIDTIIELLTEITKNFNQNLSAFIYEDKSLRKRFNELNNLYMLLGLYINIDDESITVTHYSSNNSLKTTTLFGLEEWLYNNYSDVYDSYTSAISSFTTGHYGTCIEACRTTLVGLFSKHKGTEGFAKWLRGISNLAGELDNNTLVELNNEIAKLSKSDLAEFFNENKNGKFTKTKAIYTIYSMMSDYGTHRNEGTVETPTHEDSLMMLRMTDDILLWIYMKCI